MFKVKKFLPKIISLAMVFTLVLTFAINRPAQKVSAGYLPKNEIEKLDLSVDTGIEEYLDPNVVSKLPDTISQDQDISVIIEMNAGNLLDSYHASNAKNVKQFANTKEGRNILTNISVEKNKLLRMIKTSGISYQLGESYETLFGGFEVTIKASDFAKLNNLLDDYATLMVGDVYEKCQSVVVENIVDVYETGIFDSSNIEYQGDGVVVAVLDTGLDYTHSAFSPANFETKHEKFTLDTIAGVVDDLVCSTTTRGLTAEDLYVNNKVPFAYDYGDKDPDVLPINSEHGTHVAGVIAGKDDTITGVAPNAQLAIMKVFSDTATGAKTSNILAALEDCVILGVDVINMSLGSSCGFTREIDRAYINEIYDRIHDEGISLIAAASNDNNATQGSDKNGSNGLTSNPDSGTVGAPSTYAGALSVASVDGVKTNYLLHNGEVIYFTEASTNDAEQKKSFVNDILKEVGDVDSYDFPYVTIPGVGRSSDYSESPSYYQGKIVLVKRGVTTFEDKVRVALKEKGAAGIIIYNNVSGTISMAVGENMGAVCSVSQDVGEKLAAAQTGTITVSKNNTAGPFMSDFSSWGPTSDLKIKPEITAHGGEILSAVPGQGYERLSGTSMAAPNQAGAATLIRQYVIYSGIFGENLSGKEVNALENKLMMSTGDIVINKNGLPYAVRKQGAGLINLTKATTTPAYLTTYDQDGNPMDKPKLELGDDKSRTGVYQITFGITNISNSTVSYLVDAQMMTEGVSTTYTGHDDRTVTMDGYLLNGTTFKVNSVENGTQNGNTVSVGVGQTAKVTATITLSEEDKQYLADSFEHGMYVEGFVTLKGQQDSTVDMNLATLAFYGDWTEAPIFDEEYYDTHKDEINAGLDDNDKLMPDAYATRVIGGLYSDYIATLGAYYFNQDPSSVQIAASKEHIALSNQRDGNDSTISSIRSISAGLLRNAKEIDIKITEDATGRVIFSKTEHDQMKSYSRGITIYASSIDIEFDLLKYNLKNNTKYTVTVEAYIDYGERADQKNVRNTFTFPMYVDFEAPLVQDVVYRTEYDRTSKKTHLYADVYVYDNHYAMGMQLGQLTRAEPGSEYTFAIKGFGKYVTPVHSSFNSTSMVTIELTDYVSQIKNSAAVMHKEDGTQEIIDNSNTYILTCYDYAMNSAMYEIQLPDEVLSMYFEEDTIKLSPNETLKLSDVLNIYPSSSWIETLDFETTNDNIVDVVNQTLIAKQSGTAQITAIGKDKQGNKVTTSVEVVVLAPGDEGYVGGYTIPEVNKFTLTGYKTNKAYYGLVSEDREIGLTGGIYSFGNKYTLSMFPSESVTINYLLDSYFPDKTDVVFEVSNDEIATVDQNGTLVAKKKGNTSLFVRITFDGKTTYFSQTVSITVKDPFKFNAIYLVSYKGLGGEVIIPDDRGITTIQQYAFSNYEYVDKDTSKGDVINEEDPYLIKPHYIGEDTITKVVIPEGVTEIQEYAFANLTALEEVVLPKSLTKIGLGAFYNCTKLNKINLENVKFINEKAFYNCDLTEIDLASIVAIGNYSFENCKLSYLALPTTSQSLGEGAFYNNDNLADVTFAADKIKIGPSAFAQCDNLISININAAVISNSAFEDSKSLTDVTLGKDVAVIGQYAFKNTNVSTFNVDPLNTALTTDNGGALVYKGEELILVAPQYGGAPYQGQPNVIVTDASKIGVGAFSGNVKVFKIIAKNVVSISNYAFAQCSNLREVEAQNAQEIGDYAFYGNQNLTKLPTMASLTKIGKYAFYGTGLKEVTIPDNATIDNYAFAFNQKLETVTIGSNATINEGAFFCPIIDLSYQTTQSLNYYVAYDYDVLDKDGNVVETYNYYRYDMLQGAVSSLKSVTIGDNATIGFAAFAGNPSLQTLNLGGNTTIGDRAFFNDTSLTEVDLSGVTSIGEYAFAGQRVVDVWQTDGGYRNAYEVTADGEDKVISGYKYSSFAPQIKSVDLSGVTSIGRGAFAFNYYLESATLNESLTEIPADLFAYCSNLTNVNIPSNVTAVGEFAFAGTGIKNVDLQNTTTIGQYAFAKTQLKSVTLNPNKVEGGIVLEEGAFANCLSLVTVENLQNVSAFGDGCFLSAKLTELNLESAVTIGDYAFSDTLVSKVVLGEKIEKLGENPFSNTKVTSFARTEDITFNGQVVGQTVSENYVLQNGSVQVIDGAIYQTMPNGGLELVSFPTLSTKTNFQVADNTLRISAEAFMGSLLNSVVLPESLKSIGHKAFYDMPKLSTVTFLSLDAPLLEEEYDQTILSFENLPFAGYYNGYEGLGISKYYMWNITTSFNNFYFGANFADYIGHIEQSITMVAPKNGNYYDTFIMSQYFDNVSYGAPAMTEQTKQVISAIDSLPQNILLEHKALVESVRNQYQSLGSTEQQSLVTNYAKLVQAESVIEYLSSQTKPEPTPPVDDPTNIDKPFTQTPAFGAILVVAGIVAGIGLAFLSYVLWQKIKNKKSSKDEKVILSDAEEFTASDDEAVTDSEFPSEQIEKELSQTDDENSQN